MKSLYIMSVTKTKILKITQYFKAYIFLNNYILFYKQLKHWINKSLIKTIKKCNLVSI